MIKQAEIVEWTRLVKQERYFDNTKQFEYAKAEKLLI